MEQDQTATLRQARDIVATTLAAVAPRESTKQHYPLRNSTPPPTERVSTLSAHHPAERWEDAIVAQYTAPPMQPPRALSKSPDGISPNPDPPSSARLDVARLNAKLEALLLESSTIKAQNQSLKKTVSTMEGVILKVKATVNAVIDAALEEMTEALKLDQNGTSIQRSLPQSAPDAFNAEPEQGVEKNEVNRGSIGTSVSGSIPRAQSDVVSATQIIAKTEDNRDVSRESLSGVHSKTASISLPRSQATLPPPAEDTPRTPPGSSSPNGGAIEEEETLPTPQLSPAGTSFSMSMSPEMREGEVVVADDAQLAVPMPMSVAMPMATPVNAHSAKGAPKDALLSPPPAACERRVGLPLLWLSQAGLTSDAPARVGFAALHDVAEATEVPSALVSVAKKDQYPKGVMVAAEGLSVPTIEGDWEPMLAEGKLFKLHLGGEGDGALMFYNATRAVHFTLEYRFGAQSKLRAGPKTEVADGCYVVEVPAGETVLFVQGRVNGYRMSVKYGPPSRRFIESLASVQDTRVAESLSTLRRKAAQEKVDMANDKDMIALCDKAGLVYVDCRFPPRQHALARPWEGVWDAWPWVRPQDYTTPELAAKIDVSPSGITPNDVVHGKVDIMAWLSCTLQLLAEHPALIERVFNVPEVGLAAARRTGAFPMRICKHGWWQVIVVDSYLPSTGKAPVFSSNSATTSLWASILEKGVAKVHGSYYALCDGDCLELLQDITGSPGQHIDWRSHTAWELLTALTETMYAERHVVFAEAHLSDLSVGVGSKELDGFFEATGLTPGFVYAVTAARVCEGQKMVRLRNPTGKHNGPALAEHFGTTTLERSLDCHDAFSFWVPFSELPKYFCSGGACVGPRVGLSPFACDIRVATALKGGAPLHMLEIWATEPCTCFIGLHQRDRRGLEDVDPDTTYSSFVVSVVEPHGEGWVVDSQSNQGLFNDARDVYLQYSFKKVEGLRPYYVTWRAHSSDVCASKQVVVSLLSSKPFATINIKQPSAAVMQAVRSGNLAGFDPTGSLNSFSRVQLNQREHTVRTIDMASLP